MNEIQGKVKVAQEQYLALLEEKDLSSNFRSEILRQLGCIHHTNNLLGDNRQSNAVSYLKSSIECNPESSLSYYYLGRCYASLSCHVHDAFISYRNSVDKAEANADTWCSIGVLYQQQNQALDALQAYICSAQLDKDHVASWTNLGILYENYNQYNDAFRCYLNATKGRGNSSLPALVERVKYLKSVLNVVHQRYYQLETIICFNL